MKSIRAYLLSRLLGGTALVLGGAGFAVFVAVTRSLEAQFDENLTQRVLGLASLLFQVESEVEFEFSDQLMPEYEAGELPAYFELRYEDGPLLERSSSLRGGGLAVPDPPVDEPKHWTAALPDGRAGRYVSRIVEVHHVYPEEGPGRPLAARISIVIARGREELVAARRRVLVDCAAGSLALIGLIAGLSWRAVRRGLAPAKRLGAALDAIEVDRLPDKLDVGAVPAELEPVVKKTDALLHRLDRALERERRTTADIAHELRTPISELLTVSEVALRDGRDTGGAKRALGTVRDVAWRMGRSVSTLLELARLEMGSVPREHELVDLGSLVPELLRSLASLERERGLDVRNLVSDGERVEGDPDVLRIVVSNLLSNALYYSPPRGTVTCRVDRTPDGWCFRVENGAGDLTEEDLAALAEPFWRKERARSDRERCGLGLALSRALAEKSGMALAFELEAGTFRALLSGRCAAAQANGRSQSTAR